MDITIERDEFDDFIASFNSTIPFAKQGPSTLFILPSKNINVFERKEFTPLQAQHYFYRAMTYTEASQWVNTWKSKNLADFKCWQDVTNSLSLASYFQYCNKGHLIKNGCVVLEFHAPDFIAHIIDSGIITQPKSEAGDFSWSIGQNCTSGHVSGRNNDFGEYKKRLPEIFFDAVQDIKLVAYKEL